MNGSLKIIGRTKTLFGGLLYTCVCFYPEFEAIAKYNIIVETKVHITPTFPLVQQV
jgi:hypothetical protein